MEVWPSFCAQCGQRVDRTDKFCRNCGTAVPQQPFESAGTMARPAFSEPRDAPPSTEAGVPAAEPVSYNVGQREIPPQALPAEPKPLAATYQAAPWAVSRERAPQAAPNQAVPQPVAEPSPRPAAEPSPAPTEILQQSPAAFSQPPTAYDYVAPIPTAYDYVAPEEDVKKSPRRKSRLPVLEIIVIILLLVGAAAAVWMLRSSLPAKHAVVPSNVDVMLSPTTARVAAGRAVDFIATVTGSDDVEVDWSVQEGDAGGRVVPRGAKADGGTVSTLAVYIAPETPGTYHLLATSKADSSKSASAEITVKAGKSR